MIAVTLRPPGKVTLVGARGFTLIELMVVVAIVAILAAIALPNYADYVKRGKIIQATGMLSDLRQGMEQYFLDTRSYVGYCASPQGLQRVQPVPANDAFTLSCPTETKSTYQLKAVGNPGQGMDTQFVYTVDQSGAKASTGPAGWTGNANCWAVRKSGDCS